MVSRAQGVNSVNGMAMACTTEAEVATLCMEPMKAANVEAAKVLGTIAKVKEFWTLARDEYLATKAVWIGFNRRRWKDPRPRK